MFALDSCCTSQPLHVLLDARTLVAGILNDDYMRTSCPGAGIILQIPVPGHHTLVLPHAQQKYTFNDKPWATTPPITCLSTN
jgi:hypothetical protein